MAKSYSGLFISIHALREEGDLDSWHYGDNYTISIHALREEGDYTLGALQTVYGHFYPRPPRGGRQQRRQYAAQREHISIHALREEGDSKNRDKISIFKQIIQHSARI